MILYHYTSLAGYQGILAFKRILPSLKINNPKDVRFGDGQYLSDIPPHTTRSTKLSYIFLGIPFVPRRFAYFIAIDVDGLNVIRGRDHVFVIRNVTPLDISDRLTSHGKNL